MSPLATKGDNTANRLVSPSSQLIIYQIEKMSGPLIRLKLREGLERKMQSCFCRRPTLQAVAMSYRVTDGKG